MSAKKREIRSRFRTSIFLRDNNQCRKCGFRDDHLDAHHIIDRSHFDGGGYVVGNGITLCPECHKKAEIYHSTGGETWSKGYHPDELFLLIDSPYRLIHFLQNAIGKYPEP